MSKPKPPEKLGYEQAYEELEVIVEQLESGNLPLEDALSLFERGQGLAARCSNLLEQAELKLRQLVPDDEGGYREIDLDFEGD